MPKERKKQDDKKNKIVEFLKQSKVEIKKISWLKKREAIRYTIIIIIISIVVGGFLGLLDLIFIFILNKLLGN